VTTEPKPQDYAAWRAEQDRVLLLAILAALKANPKLAAEMKIVLRGEHL
jgi:hypothetical protein